MKRVCMIGNSHLAAMKQAIDNGFTLENTEVDFFGAVLKQFADCELSDGVIRPADDRARDAFAKTSSGKTEIIVGEYDEFWVFMGKSPFFLPLYFPNTLYEPVSDGLVRAVCLSWSRDPLVAFSIHLAQSFPDLTVRFAGQPFASEAAGWAKAFLRSVPQDGAARFKWISDIVAHELEHLLPGNMRAVLPPDSCLEDHGLFTRDAMCRGSQRLLYDEEHKGGDFVHMNAMYGQEMLEKMWALS